ncbi:MAG TPA: RHS repeat-associated core domain-containing protein [Methylomirabilota bacterium]|nr:RHS repeat-associated core domain-containing protein [Methylomirabilota bacterium]
MLNSTPTATLRVPKINYMPLQKYCDAVRPILWLSRNLCPAIVFLVFVLDCRDTKAEAKGGIYSITEVAVSGQVTISTNLLPSLAAAEINQLEPGERAIIPPTIISRRQGVTTILRVTEITALDGSLHFKTNKTTFYGGGNPGGGQLPGVNWAEDEPSLLTEDPQKRHFASVDDTFHKDGTITRTTNRWVGFKDEEALRAANNAAGRVHERGAHHTRVTRIIPVPIGENKYRMQESSYVEIASGLSYQDKNGDWQEAVPKFELINGNAVAAKTLTGVTLAPNVADLNPVEMRLPDGAILRSRVLGLAYFDRRSGRSVVIAEVQPSEGELAGNESEVVYRDAFNGIDADIRYVLSRAGVEQDVIVNEAPPTPELFGFNSADVQLEVITEFFPPVEPQVTRKMIRHELDAAKRQGMAEPDVYDDLVDFGSMQFGHGQAFGMWEQNGSVKPASAVAMRKRWFKKEGRHILFEAIGHPEIKPLLDKLPAHKPRPQARVPSNTRVLPVAEVSPGTRPASLRLAVADLPKTGVVLDYTVISSYTAPSMTFAANVTYHVTGQLNITGQLTVQAGAVVKYAYGAEVVVTGGTIVGPPPSGGKAYFVADRDNTVGETVVAGAQSGPYASIALKLVNLSAAANLSNFDIRNAGKALYVFAGPPAHTFSNFRIMECDLGTESMYTTVNLTGTRYCEVPTRYYQNVSGNVSDSGWVTDCGFCAGDVHRDSPLNSTTIVVPGSQAGAIDCAGDNDFFKFQLSAPTFVSIYTTGTTDTYGHLLNSSRTVLVNAESGGSGQNFRISRYLQAGTYFIRVRHASTGTGEYVLNVLQDSLVTGVSNLTSPQNNFASWNGMRFTVGTREMIVSHLGRWVISGNSGTHALRLAPLNGAPIASVSVNTAQQAANQFVYAALSTPVTLTPHTTYVLLSEETGLGDYSYSGLIAGVSVSPDAHSPAAAYAELASPNAHIVQEANKTYGPVNFMYTLGASDDYGNTRGNASNLAANASINGTIESAGDKDMFKVTLMSPGVLRVYTTGTTYTVGELQDANGNRIGEVASNSSSANFELMAQLGAGVHYLQVSHASPSGFGGYTLHSSFAGEGSSGGSQTIAPLVTSTTLDPSTRNNWDGWIGFAFTVGATPVSVTELGRWVRYGSSQIHEVRLCTMDGNPVPYASVFVNAIGSNPGQYAYTQLGSPTVLAPNTTYALMSSESDGEDSWHEERHTQISLSGVATSPWAVYSSRQGPTVAVPPIHGSVDGEGRSYVPVSLRFQSAGNSPPTLSSIPPQTLFDGGSKTVTLSLGDAETPNNLTVTVESSNPGLIPNNQANLFVSGSGLSRTLTVTPAAGQKGDSAITVTVADSGGAWVKRVFHARVGPAQFAISLPTSITYQENETKYLFLESPSVTSKVTDPVPANTVAGAKLRIQLENGISSEDEDQLYLYLSGSASDVGPAYSSFRAEGANLFLQNTHVATLPAPGSGRSGLVLIAKGAAVADITFTPSATVEHMDGLLKNLVYFNKLEAPTVGTRTLSISIVSANGDVTGPRRMGIVVTEQPDAPAAWDVTGYVGAGGQISLNLAYWDADTTSPSVLLSQPRYGTVTLGTPPLATYTAAAAPSPAVDEFTFTVSDGVTASAVGKATIYVGQGAVRAVNAGPDLTAFVNSPIQLSGQATSAAIWTGTGAGPVAFSSATTPTTSAKFFVPGVHTVRLSIGPAQFDEANVTVIDPVTFTADAGPDRFASSSSALTINGRASSDTQEAITYQWLQMSGSTLASPPAGAALNLVGAPKGTYIYRLVARQGSLIATDEVAIHVTGGSKTWTFDADFEEGSRTDVTYDEVKHALTLSEVKEGLPHIDLLVHLEPHQQIPALVRLDAESGEVLGQFRAGPYTAVATEGGGVLAAFADPNGDTWAIVMLDNDPLDAGNHRPIVAMRFGVTTGGTRGRKLPDGTFVADSHGEYLKGPFKYNTCRDRDTDGFIRTAQGLQPPLEWQMSGNVIPSGQTLLALAQDETISEIIVTDLESLSGWSQHGNHVLRLFGANESFGFHGFEEYSSGTLQKKESVALACNSVTGYKMGFGLQVSNGDYWTYATVQSVGALFKITGSEAISCATWPAGAPQLIRRDPVSGGAWFATLASPGTVYRIDAAGSQTGNQQMAPANHDILGLAVDREGGVWATTSSTLSRLKAGKTEVETVDTSCYTSLGAMGFDWKGRLWVGASKDGEAGHDHSRVIRIDPDSGPAGAITHDRSLKWTGYESVTLKAVAGLGEISSPALAGEWRITNSVPEESPNWAEVRWNSDEPTGSSIAVEVRAASTAAGLTAAQWFSVAPTGIGGLKVGTLNGIQGSFVEVKVLFSRSSTGGGKPVLHDLSIYSSNSPRTLLQQTYHPTEDDLFSVQMNSPGMLLDVLSNDRAPLLTLTSVRAPRFGSAKVVGGKVEYMPKLNTSGDDRFIYYVTDADGGVHQALARVNIMALSALPPVQEAHGALAGYPLPTTSDTSTRFLEGVSHRVEIPHKEELGVPGDFTISFWMEKLSNAEGSPGVESADGSRLLGKGGPGNEAFGIYDPAGENAKLEFRRHNANGVSQSAFTEENFPFGVKRHVLVTCKNNVLQFYVDGAVDGASMTFSGTIRANTNPLTIGAAEGASAFGGTIGDVQIYDRALTDPEIASIFRFFYEPAIGAAAYSRKDSYPAIAATRDLVGRWILSQAGTELASAKVLDRSGVPIPGIDGGYEEWAAIFGSHGDLRCEQTGNAPVARLDLKSRRMRALPGDSLEALIEPLMNDWDADNDTITLVNDFPRRTKFGNVRMGLNNQLWYLPDLQNSGVDEFSYTIRDSTGKEGSGKVRVEVHSVTPPVIDEFTVTPTGDSHQQPVSMNLTVKIRRGEVGASDFGADLFRGFRGGELFEEASIEGPVPTTRPEITQVSFFAGSRLLGRKTSPSAPTVGEIETWSFAWGEIPANVHQLYAEVTDASGMTVHTDTLTRTVTAQFPNNQGPEAEVRNFAAEDTLGFWTFDLEDGDGPDPAGKSTQRSTIITNTLPNLSIFAGDQDEVLTDISFVSYQLRLYSANGDFLGIIAAKHSLDQVPQGRLPRASGLRDLRLDLQGYGNGAYQLELVVSDGIHETISEPFGFVLASAAQVGVFRFEEEDAIVTTAGLPIRIVRSYDSTALGDGNFGRGWRLDLFDVNAEFNEQRAQMSDILSDEPFTMRVGGGRDVTLTLPGGRRTTFAYLVTPEPALFGLAFRAKWAALPGVTAKLRTLNSGSGEDWGDNVMFKLNTLAYWQNTGLACPIVNYDIPALALELEDGTIYTIEREHLGDFRTQVSPGEFIFVPARGALRVTGITRPNGERFRVSLHGIEHLLPSGQVTRSLYFERGAGDRIIAVRDTMVASDPELVRYDYDGLGNLVAVHKLQNREKRQYATTVYKHDEMFPHYIKKVIDPRGIEAARTEYQPDGKLKEIKGADGRTTTFTYNHQPIKSTAVSRQIAKEESGVETATEMDQQGNVVLVQQGRDLHGSGGTVWSETAREFDERNNVVKEEVALAEGTLKTERAVAYFEAAPNLPSSIETTTPGGARTLETFSERGRLTSTVDARNYWSNPEERSLYQEFEYDPTALSEGGIKNVWAKGTSGTFKLRENTYHETGNLKGLLKETRDALNNKKEFRYYQAANDPNGGIGDLKEILEFDGDVEATSTIFKYDTSTGRVREQVRRKKVNNVWQDHAITRQVFDAAGRVLESEDPEGGKSRNIYDSAGQLIYSTDRYGVSRKQTYDAMGRVVQVEHPDNTVTRSAFGYAAHPTAGRVLRFEVHEDRHLLNEPVTGRRTIFDELNRPMIEERLKGVAIAFNLKGEVGETTFTQPVEQDILTRSERRYDQAGRLVMSCLPYDPQDPGSAPKWTKHEYDEAGKIWRTRNFVTETGQVIPGVTTASIFNYDQNGNRIWSIDPTNLEAVTPPVADTAAEWRLHLEAPHHSTRLTHWTYDDFNRETQVEQPKHSDTGDITAAITKSRYDKEGRRWLSIDPDGKATAYVHDALGRLRWVITDVSESVTELPAAWPTTTSGWETWAKGSRSSSVSTATEYVYDDQGNLTSQFDALRRQTKHSYDELGQRVTRTLPSGPVERTRYDYEGLNGLLKRRVHVGFSGLGTLYEHDVEGRLVQKRPVLATPSFIGGAAAANASTAYNPSGANNALKFTAALTGTELNGAKVVFIPDSTMTASSVRVSYDKASQLATIVYNGSATAITLRDAVNSTVGLPFTAALDPAEAGNTGAGVFSAGPSSDSIWTTFTYTPTGMRAEMVDNKGTSNARTTKYAYDELGRLKVKQMPEGTLSYGHDAVGNVTRISARSSYTFPSARPWAFVEAQLAANPSWASWAHMEYQHDSRNRLWKVFGAPGNGDPRGTYEYDAGGQVKTLVNGSGSLVTTYEYNSRGQLRYQKSLNGAVTHASFDYDDFDTSDALNFHNSAPESSADAAKRKLAASGLRQAVAERIIYGGVNQRRLVSYSYDGMNRLKAERARNGTTSWPAWPGVALPTSPDGGDILYDLADAYDSSGYDKVGNRQTRTENQAGVQAQSGLGYDLNDRLHYVSSPASYDGNGNSRYQATYTSPATAGLVASTSAAPDVYNADNRLVSRAGTITLVYDGDGHRVRKLNGGAATRYYLVDDQNPSGYAQVLQESAVLGGSPVMTYTLGQRILEQRKPGANTHFYGYDGHGSVRFLFAGGVVSDRFVYHAFGNEIARNGTTECNYRYAGEQWDAELGMYYLRARYYHPDLGRFWTMDSFEGNQTDPLSLNKYLYAHANPVNMVDPSGFAVEPDFGRGQDAHELFYVYCITRGITKYFDAEVGAVFPSINSRLRPDVLEKRKRRFFELKPISHESSSILSVEADLQIASYLTVMSSIPVVPGTSFELVPKETAIGVMFDPVTQRMKEMVIRPASDTPGLIYYWLRNPDEWDWEPFLVPIAIPGAAISAHSAASALRAIGPRAALGARAAMSAATVRGQMITAQMTVTRF